MSTPSLREAGPSATEGNELPEDLISRIATYLEVGSEMTNVCIAVGPAVSGSIRHAFLRDNEDILAVWLGGVAGGPDEYQFSNVSVGDKIRNWMGANEDWKHHITRENMEQYSKPTLDIEVDKDEVGMVALRFVGKGLSEYVSIFQVKGVEENFSKKYGVQTGDCFLWNTTGDIREWQVVPGPLAQRLNGKWFEAVGPLAKMKFLRNPVKVVFNNPAVAIELGLVEIIRVMVEECGLQVNDPMASNLFHDKSQPHRLIKAAMMRASLTDPHDYEPLKYIVSVPDIDLGLDVYGDDGGVLPVHFCAMSQGITSGCLEEIVSHPTFDANSSVADFTGLNFAVSCCLKPPDEIPEVDESLAKVKVLLDAGADPELGRVSSPLAFVKQTRRSIKMKDMSMYAVDDSDDDCDGVSIEVCDELIGLMESRDQRGELSDSACLCKKTL